MTQNDLNAEGQAADATANGKYAPVNGLNMYYEIHGSGEPLILLHGGVIPSGVLGANLEELVKHRQVITPHMQAHGHTRDIDRPLRTETMADDIAALIAHLGLAQVDLMGYSMGGGVALQTAIRHPALVRKLVVVSTAMRHSAWYPEVRPRFEEMHTNAAQLAAGLKQSPLAELYPDADWELIFTKLGEMVSRDHDWSEQVAGITAPTMLVFADADSILPEHMVEFYRLLGGGRRDAGLDGSLRPAAHLAIVPGTTHYTIMSTAQVAQLVEPFLSAPLLEAR
ncbi:MAG TPA: alpha/beta hydrolase [Herpetosiphonaceae bacterium]